MGRPRKYPSDAARQHAYRVRQWLKRPPEEVVVPGYFDRPRPEWNMGGTLHEFVRSAIVDGGIITIAFAAERLKVSRKVIRACLDPPTCRAEPAVPQLGEKKGVAAQEAPGTKRTVTKLGRPRIWDSDSHRKYAYYMRRLAKRYHWTGFWAEDAKRVDAMRQRTEAARAFNAPVPRKPPLPDHPEHKIRAVA